MNKANKSIESPLHIAIVVVLLTSGAAASAGPFAQFAKDGFLAAYPGWFSASLAYAVALALIGFFMQGRINKFDVIMLAAAFATPVFISALNVISAIAPGPERQHGAIMEMAPTMHAVIFFTAIAAIFAKGVTAFVTRWKVQHRTSK